MSLKYEPSSQVVSLHPAEEVRNERDKHRFHDLSEVWCRRLTPTLVAVDGQ